jgi:hypothetical protein
VIFKHVPTPSEAVLNLDASLTSKTDRKGKNRGGVQGAIGSDCGQKGDKFLPSKRQQEL